MTKATIDNTIARWTRIGVLFGAAPSRTTPDLERLLLDTARLAPANSRLYTLAITWLSQYDQFVARHRLKRLILTDLEPDARPVLGLILDLAIKHGAARSLNTAANACGITTPKRPLFNVHLRSKTRIAQARHSACDEARQRGLWAPDVEIKPDALRPAWWIVQNNPDYRDRALRKGDLRTTIVETLRRDVPDHTLDSELELVEFCAANRPAVSAALDDLELEGTRLRHPDEHDRRRHRIALQAPA